MVASEAIISGISYSALALFLGCLVTAGFLLPAGEPRELRQNLLGSALALLLLFLLSACAGLFIQGAKLQRGLPSADILRRYLTLTQSGKVWLLRESYGALLAVIALWPLRNQASLKGVRWLALLALPLIAGRSLTSHAIAVKDDTALILAADATHLIATGLWAGGLPMLFWVLYRGMKKFALPLSWAAEIVRRFSLLALASVAVLLLTGLYQSLVHVGTLNTLFTTDYGRVLLLKMAVFLGMLCLGALNFFSTKRKLFQAAQRKDAGVADTRSALARIGAESSLALMIFFVTGLLTVLPPGVHALHQSNLANASPGGPGRGTTTALQPAQGARVKILSPTPSQVFTRDQVPLKFQLTKGKRGTHVHAYVDGELMGMFESTAGTLNGITPGHHVLELRVVAEDHQTELNATDRTDFIVK